MKIAIVASLFAIRDMNVYSSQSFTFDVKILVFEKLSLHPDPSPDGKCWPCSG
jgi:hypothetical protein